MFRTIVSFICLVLLFFVLLIILSTTGAFPCRDTVVVEGGGESAVKSKTVQLTGNALLRQMLKTLSLSRSFHSGSGKDSQEKSWG